MTSKHLLATLCAGLMSLPALASPEAELLARLRQDYPGTQWDSVQASPIAGLYEVTTGKNLVYADLSGRYVLFGHIWDMPGQRDLTAARKADLARVADVDARLPAEDALVVRRGPSPTLRVAIFSDPACGYCRRLEQTLNQLPQLEVRVYLTPLQPGGRPLAEAIWCAPDRGEAWLDQMLRSQAPQSAACDTAALDRNLALSRELGIQGTPTLVAPDGRVMAGAASAPEIVAWLGQATAMETAR